MAKTNITIKRNDSVSGIFEGADILSAHAQLKFKGQPTSSDFGIYHSGIVLRALAIELALKCILDDSTGAYERTHSVVALFEDLPENIRNEITREYNDTQTSNPEWPDVDALISNVDSIFVEWRYATFGASHLNISIGAWECLGKIVKQQIPQS